MYINVWCTETQTQNFERYLNPRLSLNMNSNFVFLSLFIVSYGLIGFFLVKEQLVAVRVVTSALRSSWRFSSSVMLYCVTGWSKNDTSEQYNVFLFKGQNAQRDWKCSTCMFIICLHTEWSYCNIKIYWTTENYQTDLSQADAFRKLKILHWW